MTDFPVSQAHHQSFEGIRQQDEAGNEFWSARDLAPLLEYQDWRNFMQVADKARLACEQSGQPVGDHFGETTKMVPIGSNAQRKVPDVHLSRYACYLIVQNGDPGKAVIANGQTYFATQTRRQELADASGFGQLSEDQKRLAIRNELAQHNKYLAAAAAEAGVESGLDFAIFQDHGYRGLYDGLGAKALHAQKGLKKARKSLITWAARSWRPTCSAPRKPRKNCDAMGSKASRRQIRPILLSAKKCARPSRNWVAPCRKTCQRRNAASSKSRMRSNDYRRKIPTE